MTHLLLQAAELTKTGTDAAAAVTSQMSQQGPLFLLLWVLVLAAVGIACVFFWKYDKLREAYNADLAKAREEERIECARQQAIDNAHYEALLKESRERERDAINRLDTINRELRQQEGKSIDVIAGLRTALGQFSGQLQTLHFFITTGRGVPPLPPPPELPQ